LTENSYGKPETINLNNVNKFIHKAHLNENKTNTKKRIRLAKAMCLWNITFGIIIWIKADNL